MLTAIDQAPDVAFVSSVSLARSFTSKYTGSGAVVLTNGGGHRSGAEAVLLFPAGTATSVTMPWTALEGSEPFSALHNMAYYFNYVGSRMRVVTKRVIPS